VNESPTQCVLFFIKAPEKGRVKTRLATAVGEDRAVGLYQCFVEDILAMLGTLAVEVQCCYQPAHAEAALREWLGPQCSYVPQQGEDLGRRMENAFRRIFEAGISRAVVIGSDSPDLAANTIEEAFARLQTHDAVIGPSSDGGYYLLGFNAERFVPEAFTGIAWSTDHVFGQTLDVLNQYGHDVFVLPQWHDVDTRSDLEEFVSRNHDTEFEKSNTFNLLRRWGWEHVRL
jgi:uncharacterized protein